MEEQLGKQYHIFVSYRVSTDADLAERIVDKLQGLLIQGEKKDIRIKCYFDKQDLKAGIDFTKQFLEGLHTSCLFLPLISEACLETIFAQAGGDDNVIKEWNTALRQHNTYDSLDMIPLLVGSTVKLDRSNVYKKFNGFGRAYQLPDIHPPSSSDFTIKETVLAFFKLQGIFVDPADVVPSLALIQNRFSTEVWPKFRGKWANQHEIGPEPQLKCVQCNNMYLDSENADGMCRFHVRGGCCGYEDEDNFCRSGKHASVHHTLYSYTNYYVWRYSIFQYSSHTKTFGYVSADDWESNEESVVTASCGAILEEFAADSDKLFVDLGCGDNVWFQVYSKSQLASIAASVQNDKESLLVSRTGPSGEYTKATWLIENSEISGVRLEVSSKTSLNPSIVTVHFEWPTANSEFDKKNGPALKSRQFASSPQFGELPISTRSENPYSLPSRPLFKGNRIQEFINRPGDANLARWAVPAKTPLRLNVIESFPYHDPNTRVDWFNSKVSVLNSSALPTSIVAVRAFARLRMPLGDVTLKFPDNSGDNSSVGGSGIILSHIWKPVSNVVINSAKLPTQVGALGSADLGVSVGIEADKYYEADDARGMHGWRKPFSWIVLQSGFPVVVDLELEDIHGRIFGGVVEFPITNFNLPSPNADSVFHYSVDDTFCADREIVQLVVEPQVSLASVQTEISESVVDDSQGEIYKDPMFRRDHSLQIKVKTLSATHSFNLSVLRHFVLLAETATQKEKKRFGTVDMSKFCFDRRLERAEEQFHHEAAAIVDLTRRIVIAIRFQSESRTSCTIAYFPIPEYGDAVDADIAGVAEISAAGLDFADWEAEEGSFVRSAEVSKSVQAAHPIPDRTRVSTAAADADGPVLQESKAVDISELVAALRPVIAEELRPVIREELRPIIEKELRESIRAEINASVKASFKETMVGLLAEMKKLDEERGVVADNVDHEISSGNRSEEYKPQQHSHSRGKSLSISSVFARFKWQ